MKNSKLQAKDERRHKSTAVAVGLAGQQARPCPHTLRSIPMISTSVGVLPACSFCALDAGLVITHAPRRAPKTPARFIPRAAHAPCRAPAAKTPTTTPAKTPTTTPVTSSTSYKISGRTLEKHLWILTLPPGEVASRHRVSGRSICALLDLPPNADLAPYASELRPVRDRQNAVRYDRRVVAAYLAARAARAKAAA